jgi:serine/threonine protein kinase/Tol biopolymer transport system component
MSLGSGTRLGPYEIQAALGVGGMGEVYKAKDTRLDRTVAIKVLPEHLASDPQFRERFDREARAISSLNHPHICTLHDVGRQDLSTASTGSGHAVDFLVLEYLEGETLADRIAHVGRVPRRSAGAERPEQATGRSEPSARAGLPLDEALAIAVQIADALAAAHRARVVHRDLKPGNIFLVGKRGSAGDVRRGGSTGAPLAKLLDFGLAKAAAPAVAGTSLSNAETRAPALTGQGTILGTFQYMAPEQLEGKDADARTDLFAFGAVLYEMLTGRKAFEGESHASLMGAIMHADPAPLSSVQPLAPRSVERIVRKCLAKDPDDRWQTARDLLDELKWVADAGAEPRAEPRAEYSAAAPLTTATPRRVGGTRVAWTVAALAAAIALVVAAAVWQQNRDTPAPRPVTRFEIAVPPTDSPASLALSPDGRQLAYVATTEGQSRVWVRSLDGTAARMLPGTEGASFPFWNPEARAIGFFAEGKLKRVDLAGGPPQVLADAPNGRGGTWNSEGVILFTPISAPTQPTSVVMRVSASGGTPVPVTRLAPGESSHRWPQFLPDGRRFIFFSPPGVARADTNGIFLGSLDGGEPRRVLATETPGVFVPPDRLLLVRGDALMAVPFDAARGVVADNLMPLAHPVGRDDGVLRSAFAASAGTLAYRATGGGQRRQLVWMDRTGKMVGSIGSPDNNSHAGLALDPTGQRIAVFYSVLGNFDIWLLDASRGIPARFTFDPGFDFAPQWSPDGRRVIFASRRSGPMSLYEKSASGVGDEQMLAADAGVPHSWSPDGRVLLYSRPAASTGIDLWALPMTDERLSIGSGRPVPAEGRKPFAVVQSAMDQPGGEFSPDGRWLAYESNESGRFEVHAQPFPEAGGKWQVSSAGGTQPRWRRDGKELYYVAPDARLMAVPVTVSPDGKTLNLGVPVPLFGTRLASGAGVNAGRPEYAVAPDGRFLMNTVVEDTAPPPITIVLNWEEALAP